MLLSVRDSVGSSFRASVKTTSDEYIQTFITIPPDGGWGWIVVVGSFLCNFVADGAIYTFGIFLTDISQTFHTTPTTVATANSLMAGFYYVSGPVSCALVNRLGFQVTGCVGGLIAASAFVLSTLTTSVDVFCVVAGLFGGFGFGLVYVPSVVVIGFYFEKWRALATSIAVTGSAAGIIGFPIIIDTLLSGHTWQTKFRVIAGLCLIIAALALVYRPIKPTQIISTKDKKSSHLSPGQGAQSLSSFEPDGDSAKKTYNRFHNIAYPTQASIYKDSTFVMHFPPGPSTSSVFIRSVPQESATTVDNSKMEGYSDRFERLSTVHEVDDNENCYRKCCCEFRCCHWCCGAMTQNRPMYRDDIFYTGSVYTLPEYTQSKSSHLSKMKSVDYTLSVTRVELMKERRPEEREICRCCPEAIIRTLVTMLNFNLLSSPSFLFLSISGFFTVLGMYIPFTYLIERANENHISKDMSTHFYTCLGAFNAVGRITSGIISTLPQAKPLLVSYVSLSICGLATFVSYFLHDAYSEFTYTALFGLTIACFGSLRAPIVVELLGLENLTNAFGLMLLFHGGAAFIGLPLAGKIVQASESFNKSFLFSAASILFSAILLMPIERISAWEQRKTKI